MNDIGFLEAIILGLVEGLTEFIPVSSTGHLILVGNLLGVHSEKAKVFEVCIQFGAICAVGLLYIQKLIRLLDVRLKSGFEGFYGLVCLFLGCLPALVLGALFSSKIKALLFYPIPVGIALIVGALLIIFVEKKAPPVKYSSLDQLSPKACFGVGLFQALSLWPGMSRAATSILGGLALGLDRKIAAEFSFLMAVPLIGAATLHDVYESRKMFAIEDLLTFGIGSFVAFVSAWFAVKAFVSLLSRVSLIPFAYYRLAVGLLVLIYFA